VKSACRPRDERAAGETVAIHTRRSVAPTSETRYLHRDHLGCDPGDAGHEHADQVGLVNV
jgi:hypothetical protein